MDLPKPIRAKGEDSGAIDIDIGKLTPEQLANLQIKVTAGEIADFVDSLACKFLERKEITDEIRRRWGSVECQPAEGYVENAPAIEDVFADLAKEVPDAEWDKLPPDLTDRLDHHLYDDAEGGR